MASWSLSQLYIQNYLIIASITVVYYDYFITLDDERRCIWTRWKAASSWMFFVNRYFTFFSTITWVGSFLPWHSVEGFVYHSWRGRLTRSRIYWVMLRCNAYSMYRQIITGVIEFIVIVNMFLRVFALYGKDKRILALGIGVFLVMVALGILGFSGDNAPTIVLSAGCHVVISAGAKFATAWAAMLASDVLIFALTVAKTYNTMHGLRRYNSGNLSALMLRDGAMYYVTLTCLNLTNLLTFFLLPNALKGSLASLVGNISSVLLSRMMLNLQKSVDKRIPQYTNLFSGDE
ncbi:hypothetical protein NM688_g4316 [Phlebia brevispora]|uniref:Uncharacterized protein n=1 Tax=Phlebia brevispora TaxID=194682 RepID=A0ACC1T3B4_9APHY|nr:hypothetical protein NM688_g4316 [Phlebia brevispora]